MIYTTNQHKNNTETLKKGRQIIKVRGNERSKINSNTNFNKIFVTLKHYHELKEKKNMIKIMGLNSKYI